MRKMRIYVPCQAAYFFGVPRAGVGVHSEGGATPVMRTNGVHMPQIPDLKPGVTTPLGITDAGPRRVGGAGGNEKSRLQFTGPFSPIVLI